MNSDSQHWHELQELFDLAEAAPANERTGVLKQVCTDDLLRDRVLALLRAAELPPAVDRDPAEQHHRQIGPYNILRLIGSGGVGTVYLAERTIAWDVQQRVALKILAPHAAGSSFVDRFAREQRILASLDHPSITRLLDAGISDLGQPYLVMEYVEGEHLDAFCVSRNLDQRARLALFGKICAAVAYAHRSLVLHLDLKPSNILVTPDGMPKLLDFGTAKLLEPDRNFTSTVMATPAYASPEQLSHHPVTTLSDIYSLGVILFELMTGQRPGEDSTTALSGDLLTITRKCLAATPGDRYATVDALADDIARYAGGLPILARPQTLTYRVRKFVRRNTWNVALVASVILGMASAIAYSFWQARTAQRHLSELSRMVEGRYDALMRYQYWMRMDPATSDFDQLRASVESIPTSQLTPKLHRILADGYVSLGRSNWSPYSPSRMDPEQALIAFRKAFAHYNWAALSDDPQGVLVLRSSAAMDLSAVMAETGDGDGSFAVVVNPIVELLRIHRIDDIGAHYDVLSDRLGKKTPWARQPELSTAAPETLAKLLKIPLSHATDLAAVTLYQKSKANSQDPSHASNPLVDLQLGRLLAESGQPEQGRKLLEPALAAFIAKRNQSVIAKGDSDVVAWERRAAGAHLQLGRIDEAQGRLTAALDQYEASRKGLEGLMIQTNDPYYFDRVALANLNSARVLTRLGRRDQALPLARSAAETLRGVAQMKGMAAERLELIAYHLLTLEPAEARNQEAALAAAEAAVRRSKGRMPSYLLTLAAAQFATGRPREAEATARASVPIYRKALSDLGPLFSSPDLREAKGVYDRTVEALGSGIDNVGVLSSHE